MLVVPGGEAGHSRSQASLTFNRYGDRYFLEQVSGPYRGWKLAKPPAEKELSAKAAPRTSLILAAAYSK